ncbi:pimeloyl-ACP methyl ester carboxylesterase [Chitinophaga dinghuensis]|uniref:Pimeloyl-ACP methyl ester carboxylesterase n=1 Tax=Chitinophaga dinghuensis TaxID=1539050 RepID=A0A327VUS3_9BACT|nr:alpha/beta hydrolase [Chitinophaga dinghuensis]RAJ79000.1 pimeloyl-ACP methyl ester carboxylesterase [Chitinophaga dinghuensis]
MTFTTHTTTSKDGAIIGYKQTGAGKGLIICHGAARSSAHYEDLALALADRFTVYIPDRRGRGCSGDEGPHYGLQQAVEDLAAVIKVTAPDFIFGHSAGAMIALETMLTHPVKQLAIYEPPISVDRSFPFSWIPDFETALRNGDKIKAMAISLKGLNIVEGIGKLPIWAIVLFIQALSFTEEKGQRMVDLIPTLRADIHMAEQLDSQVERYREVTIPVCLMAGTKSPEYFHTGLKALSAVLPQSDTKIFDWMDHYSPEGNVVAIANHLKRFFSMHTTVVIS